ncbi:hypothetical protein HC928_11265 [bacterium]|nr:hypothetical protein [bacterium]
MKWQYDLDGYLIGAAPSLTDPSHPDPRVREIRQWPARSTELPPPELEPSQRARWDGKAWQVEETPEPEPQPEPELQPELIAWGEFFRVLGMIFVPPMNAIATRNPHLHGLLLLAWNRRANEVDAEDGRLIWNALLSEPEHAAIAADIRMAMDADQSLVQTAEQAIAAHNIPWQIQSDYKINRDADK